MATLTIQNLSEQTLADLRREAERRSTTPDIVAAERLDRAAGTALPRLPKPDYADLTRRLADPSLPQPSEEELEAATDAMSGRATEQSIAEAIAEGRG